MDQFLIGPPFLISLISSNRISLMHMTIFYLPSYSYSCFVLPQNGKDLTNLLCFITCIVLSTLGLQVGPWPWINIWPDSFKFAWVFFSLFFFRRQKRTASHSVQSLQELKSRGRICRPVLCPLHPGQELRLFCQPCDIPVCLECAATLHRDHHCRPTNDVVDQHGDQIRELVSGHLRPLLERLEESAQKVKPWPML